MLADPCPMGSVCRTSTGRLRAPESATGWLIFSFFLPYLAAPAFAVIGSPKLPRTRRAQQRTITTFIDERIDDERDPALAPVVTLGWTQREAVLIC